MDLLTDFRDSVKDKAKVGASEIFRLCDELRDDKLPLVGIRLEDRHGQKAIWGMEDPEVMRLEKIKKIEEKAKQEEEKRLKKEEEIRKKSTPPQDWFKTFFTDKNYTKFDDKGIPTHKMVEETVKNAETGEEEKKQEEKEVSKEIRNKLQKEWNTQEKTYKKWIEQQ